jgi:hypothetical protein
MQSKSNRWSTHWDAGHNWALVLAAGEGARIQALTMTASGIAIPKQFCSLNGGGLYCTTLCEGPMWLHRRSARVLSLPGSISVAARTA